MNDMGFLKKQSKTSVQSFPKTSVTNLRRNRPHYLRTVDRVFRGDAGMGVSHAAHSSLPLGTPFTKGTRFISVHTPHAHSLKDVPSASWDTLTPPSTSSSLGDCD